MHDKLNEARALVAAMPLPKPAGDTDYGVRYTANHLRDFAAQALVRNWPEGQAVAWPMIGEWSALGLLRSVIDEMQAGQYLSQQERDTTDYETIIDAWRQDLAKVSRTLGAMIAHPAPTQAVDDAMVQSACDGYDTMQHGSYLEPANYPAMHRALTAALSQPSVIDTPIVCPHCKRETCWHNCPQTQPAGNGLGDIEAQISAVMLAMDLPKFSNEWRERVRRGIAALTAPTQPGCGLTAMQLAALNKEPK